MRVCGQCLNQFCGCEMHPDIPDVETVEPTHTRRQAGKRHARFWHYSHNGGWVRVSLTNGQNLIHWWKRRDSVGFSQGAVEFEYRGGIVSVTHHVQHADPVHYWADHDQLDCWFSEEINGEVHPVPNWQESGPENFYLDDSPEDYEMECPI